MTVHHLIIIEPTDATIIRCIFLELNQFQHAHHQENKNKTVVRLHSNNSFKKVHTVYTTAPHNYSQHNQVSSHEILTSLVLVLLMMGVMMPETC
jgi:hypothetical protein